MIKNSFWLFASNTCLRFYSNYSYQLGQRILLVQYRTIFRYHLLILLFPVDEVCLVCRKTYLDTFREHAVHCRKLMNSNIGMTFLDMLFFINFDELEYLSINRRMIDTYANICLGIQQGMRETCMCEFDWNFVGIRINDFTVGQATLKVTSNKVVKYEKLCFNNQLTSIQFAFDTFGFLALQTTNLL